MAQLTQLEDERPRGKHVFTRADTLLGAATSRAKRSYKEKLNYAKKLQKLALDEKWFDLARGVLASPVAAGTVSYLAVLAIEQISKKIAAAEMTLATPPGSPPATPPAPPSILQSLEKDLSGLLTGAITGTGSVVSSISGTSQAILGALSGPMGGLLQIALSGTATDLTALKIAILLYIASGGNLAGLLSSSSSAFSSIASAIGGIAPVAAAAVA
jgi:hypothetical protein